MFTSLLIKDNKLAKIFALTAIAVAVSLQIVPNVAQAQASDPLYRVTNGTLQSSMPYGQGVEDMSSHGFRFVCVPSHFSYDDPVVFPGQPGAAHLHMFFGNTAVDYLSTSESIVNTGRVTCAGGITNRSAYWVPAMFNAAGEPVLPSFIIDYYKSWSPDRNQLQPIPQGLQILANDKVKGASGVIVARPGHPEDIWPADIGITESDEGGVHITVSFPDCVAVDSNGNPVLTSPGGTSHVAYANGSSCPSSHPYHIPTLTQNIDWHEVPFDSDWQLASDPSPAAKGTTAHADYMAGWTVEAAQIMVDCVREGHRECGPPLVGNDGELSRSPSGETLYNYQHLVSSADETPMGVMPKMLNGQMNMGNMSNTDSNNTGSSDQTDNTSDDEDQVACCMAMTASCLACSAGVSADAYCEDNPLTTGCEDYLDDDTFPIGNQSPTDVADNITTISDSGDFQRGDSVVTTENINLRQRPSGTVLMSVPAGTEATVSSWVPYEKDGYTWMRISLEDGTWGYVATEYLANNSSSNTTNTANQTQDQNQSSNSQSDTEQSDDEPEHIRTTDNLNVRSTPGGDKITVKPEGSRCRKLSDSSVRQGDHDWVKVQFDDGVTGYVAEAYTEPEENLDKTAPASVEAQQQDLRLQIQYLMEQLAELQALYEELFGSN